MRLSHGLSSGGKISSLVAEGAEDEEDTHVCEIISSRTHGFPQNLFIWNRLSKIEISGAPMLSRERWHVLGNPVAFRSPTRHQGPWKSWRQENVLVVRVCSPPHQIQP
ncbi:hypothetical protein CDAR_615891 [Caerostris darwini]|uniref:Uncharacterized protein n=1 Tax=Caerostris darwini TaxID=1538125 RepID=A0AAV4RWZ9_9ARAC|nr:hypothetical protein CDAR_615891 [Caerostris darwini]